MPFDRLGAIAAWAVTAPARRLFFDRRGAREVRFASEDGVALRGWLFDSPAARATVVLGHGYRDDRRQLAILVPALSNIGLRVLAIDFRAHGRSGGDRITIGVEESRDVRASLAWASDQFPEPVSYVGFSMGAAAYLLSGVEAKCAVLDSPYDTLAQAIEARAKFARVPAALADAFRRAKAARSRCVIDEVRPVDAAARLVSPPLFVFARGDAWIPAESRDAFRSSMSPACELIEVDGAHDGHFDARWIARVASFLERWA